MSDNISLPDDDNVDAIDISIMPRVKLEVVCKPEQCTFEITGPAKALATLKPLAESSKEELKGRISPLNPVTVPKAYRKGAGIPLDADYFAFLYPLEAGMQASLQGLNLERDPWAFALILGGYCYFDASGEKVIAVNALILAPSAASLSLEGRKSPSKALDALGSGAGGRLVDTTLPALKSAGFLSFAWVHPEEPIDGLSDFFSKHPNPHGGFIYRRCKDPEDTQSSEAWFYALTIGAVRRPKPSILGSLGSSRNLMTKQPSGPPGGLADALERIRKTSEEAMKKRDAAGESMVLRAAMDDGPKEPFHLRAKRAARRLLILITYLIVGMVFYANVNIDYTGTHPYIAAFYFSFTTMSTVGCMSAGLDQPTAGSFHPCCPPCSLPCLLIAWIETALHRRRPQPARPMAQGVHGHLHPDWYRRSLFDRIRVDGRSHEPCRATMRARLRLLHESARMHG